MTNVFPNSHDLAALEKQHSDALTRAESLPAGSTERARAELEAERIEARIHDWHEAANPTPLA